MPGHDRGQWSESRDGGNWTAPGTRETKGPRSSLGDFVRLIGSAKPSVPALALALFLGAASTIGGLFVPLLTKGLVNGFSLSSVGAGKVGLIARHSWSRRPQAPSRATSSRGVGQGVVAALRERLWRKELGLPGGGLRQGRLGRPRLEDDQRYGRGEGLHHRQPRGLGDRRHLHRRGDGLPPLPELEDDADHPRRPCRSPPWSSCPSAGSCPSWPERPWTRTPPSRASCPASSRRYGS